MCSNDCNNNQKTNLCLILDILQLKLSQLKTELTRIHVIDNHDAKNALHQIESMISALHEILLSFGGCDVYKSDVSEEELETIDSIGSEADGFITACEYKYAPHLLSPRVLSYLHRVGYNPNYVLN